MSIRNSSILIFKRLIYVPVLCTSFLRGLPAASGAVNTAIENQKVYRENILLEEAITTSEVQYTLSKGISNFTYLEIIVDDGNYVRGSCQIPRGRITAGIGLTIPCYYGGSLYSVVIKYVDDTHLKIYTGTQAISFIFIYGTKINTI